MKHIYKHTHNKIVTIMVAFDAGARAESDKYPLGIAHMLEHMMFKGTEKRNYLQIPKDIAFLGGNSNAFTSNEMVAYYIDVPYENFESAAEILSDIVFNSVFPKEEFKKEKEVVLEEALSAQDSVTYDLQQTFISSFFDNRLATDVIGTIDSIKNFTYDDLISFYKEFYKTENAILAISGNLSTETMKDVAKKYFGEETDFVRKTTQHDFHPKSSMLHSLKKKDLNQSYVYIAYPGLSKADENRPTAKVLEGILGSGMDSRLFTEIREKNNLCYSIGLSSLSFLECGSFVIHSSTREDNIPKMLDLISKELEKIKSCLVSDEELQREKNKIKAQLYRLYDSGHSLARDELNRAFFNLQTLDEVSSKIDKVTKKDIIELAKNIFNDLYKMTYIMQPGDDK